MKKQYLESGKIVTTHGVRGEVRVQPWCDTPGFLTQFACLYLDARGSQARVVERARVHKNIVIVKFEGVENVEDAAGLRGKTVYIDRADVELEEGECFVQDLIGCTVRDADTGADYGQVYDVRATGANANMARAQGINTNFAKVLGLVVSNGLVALSGALLAQYNSASEINMGRGAIVIGLAAVIIGEVIFGKVFINFALKLFAVVLGSIIYYIVLQAVLALGLNANYLKLLAALVVELPPLYQNVRPATPQAYFSHPGGYLDINTANAAELELIEGVGPVKAQRIVEYREAHGPFASVEELALVDGISQKTVLAAKEMAVALPPE